MIGKRMKHNRFKLFLLNAIFVLISISLSAGISNLKDIEILNQLKKMVIVFKFDKVPEYKSKISDGSGNIGNDYIEEKLVKTKKNNQSISINITFSDTDNKSGVSDLIINKSVAISLKIALSDSNLSSNI